MKDQQMVIKEFSLTTTSIRGRIANADIPLEASQWIEFAMPAKTPLGLANPNGANDIPLGEMATRQLASIQLAVLRHVRDAISEEIQRLSSLSRS